MVFEGLLRHVFECRFNCFGCFEGFLGVFEGFVERALNCFYYLPRVLERLSMSIFELSLNVF